MSEWKIKLKGEDSYLRNLCSLYRASELSIEQESDSYYLKSSTFQGISDADKVRADAKTLLRFISGIQKFNFGDSETVEIEEIHETDNAGRLCIHLLIEGSLRFMVPRIKIRDGKLAASWDNTDEAEQRAVVQRLVKLAFEHEAVAKVFRILEWHEADWNALYKLWEIVREDVGDGLHSNGWVTKSDINLLTHTANSYLAIGEEARHAHERFPAPATPMSLSCAENLIMDVLAKWICSKD